MKQYYNLKRSIFASLTLLGLSLVANTSYAQLYDFSEHTFTNAGADGRTGPIYGDCVAEYVGGGALWAGDLANFNVTDGVQKWTVPLTADYRFEVAGGQGGFHAYTVDPEDGGLGAIMTGTYALTEGQMLFIVVGQIGVASREGGGGNEDNAAPGGGGGTYVWDAADDAMPLMAAGGGGAGGSPGGYANRNATVALDGNNASAITNGGIGGNGGRNNNGGSSWWGGAGSGWLTNGTGGNKGALYDYTPGLQGAEGGRRPLEGAFGGIRWNDGSDEGGDGGFGGGGGGGSDNMEGGGGGGYSGGGGGRSNVYAGGGGSFNGGIDQTNVVSNEGNGYVKITIQCIPLTLDIPVTGVCDDVELFVSALSESGGDITWSGGIFNDIFFAPPPGTTTTYIATSTSPDDCPFSVDISSSPIPVITGFSSVPAACEGATVTLWGEGGLTEGPGDEVYTWTGTGIVTPTDSVAFVAEPGVITYTVIGTYLGCEGPPSDVILVGASQPDVSGIADPDQLCLGDDYILSGASDFATSYSWGGGITDGGTITPVAAGTFIHFVVGMSDDGCTDTAFVTVVVNSIPVVDAGDDITVCGADEITLSGSGATDYDWSPAATDGEAFVPEAGITTYTVTGTDVNGCTDDDDVVVTVVELPYVASAIVEDEFFGFDGSIDITVAGGSGDYTFSWSHGPTTEDVDGLTSGIIYTVSIDDVTIDPGMCTTSESYTLSRFIGLDGETISQLSAYPNPTNDQLTVVYNGQFNYEVTTLLGEVIAVGKAVDQEQLSMKDFANGTYIVKVISGDNINYVQVVKQ